MPGKTAGGCDKIDTLGPLGMFILIRQWNCCGVESILGVILVKVSLCYLVGQLCVYQWHRLVLSDVKPSSSSNRERPTRIPQKSISCIAEACIRPFHFSGLSAEPAGASFPHIMGADLGKATFM